MRVIFGSQTIKAFVASPRNVKILGIVRMDLEFGLLGVDAQGQYMRVNGSQIEPLNTMAVRTAINKARSTSRSDPFEGLSPDDPCYLPDLTPKVTVKKRRRLAEDCDIATHRQAVLAN